MRPRSEIIANPRVRNPRTLLGIDACDMTARGGRLLVTFSANEDGWEHVAVSPAGSKSDAVQPCPTWEQMCDVKRAFWGDGEMVLQLHPPESEYFHGPGGMSTNILHLWRPCGGDWARLGEKETAE